MKSIFYNAIAMLISITAFGDCGSAYQAQIKNLEGKMNPPRTTIISNIIAEGAVVGTLAAVGTLPVTAVVALPAAAMGAGAYYGYLVTERNGLRKAVHLIRDAHRGEGATLDLFMRKLNRHHTEFDKEEVIQDIRQADYDNSLCEFNELKDSYKLMTFHRILRSMKKNEIISEDDA